MFRTLFLLIAIGIVIWIAGRMFKNKALGSKPKQKPDNEIKKIVQCSVCNVFIPEDSAIKRDQNAFCSQEHLDQWNKRS